MEIQIDREELQRIQEKQRGSQNADDSHLGAEFIAFDNEDEIMLVSGTQRKEDEGPSKVEVSGGDKASAARGSTPSAVDKIANKNEPQIAATTNKRPAAMTSVLRFNVPWMDPRKRAYSLNPMERLHQEVVDFANYVSPTEEERFSRSEALRRVNEVVVGIWPVATVQVFGSFDSQLYLPSSDLDVVVILPDAGSLDAATGVNPAPSSASSLNLSSASQRPPLKKLAKALLKAGVPIPDTLKVIANARVPIIKYIDKQTDFEIDVSINVISGLEAAKFMRDEMRKQPAVRTLTLILKHFLEMRRLNEVFTGGLGSYSIMCLVISFLQAHPLIQSGLIRAHENLGVLMMEFFELYGKNFNYEVVGISVLDDGVYFEKENRGWVNEGRPNNLSIEDPQNIENDISKGSFAVNAVRQSFEHAFNVLKCAINEYEAYLGRRVERASSATSIYEKNEPSLLGSIISFNDKLLRHRYYIQQTTNL